MKNYKIKLILMVIVPVIGLKVLNAQATYDLSVDKTAIRVTGTSNVHDWEMDVEHPSGRAVFNMNSTSPSGIENLYLTIRSDRIVSGKSIMDQKTRNALLADEFSEISFRLDEVTEFTAGEGKLSGNVKGTLFVAGRIQVISLPFSGTYRGDLIEISGNKSLNMSDFDVKPPIAMLGALKTGDTVGIIFITTWVRHREESAFLGD